MKATDLLVIGGVAALAYWWWNKKFTGPGSLYDKAITGIANEYVDLTTGPTAQSQLTNQVLMPDGSNFSTAQLQNYAFGFQGNVAMFVKDGVQYSLQSHDANGNYVATRV